MMRPAYIASSLFWIVVLLLVFHVHQLLQLFVASIGVAILNTVLYEHWANRCCNAALADYTGQMHHVLRISRGMNTTLWPRLFVLPSQRPHASEPDAELAHIFGPRQVGSYASMCDAGAGRGFFVRCRDRWLALTRDLINIPVALARRIPAFGRHSQFQYLPPEGGTYVNLPPTFLPTGAGVGNTNIGLIVLIHGLGGHPSQFTDHLDIIDANGGNYDRFLPFVRDGGSCGVALAAAPILDIIVTYIEEYPARPVTLVGVSNGGRIAAYIEIKLRELTRTTNVFLVAIAGPHHGTYMVDVLHDLSARFGLEELRFLSNTTSQQVMRMCEPLPQGTSEHSFLLISGSEDTHIIPYISSLPVLGHNEISVIAAGEGHTSILSNTAEFVMMHVMRWMRQRATGL